MTFELANDTTSGSSPMTVRPTAVASNQLGPTPRTMPTLIPASELYFWSERWQDQEREFERDRAAGRLIESNSMDEVIHELMRVDDDDDEGE